MSKFTETIKGFINKHFTGEVTCANCGKTGKIMFFSTLKDGNHLCSHCKHEIPHEFGFEAKESTMEDFKELYDFMQHSKTVLEPIFKADKDYSYGLFEVDPVHNLCRVDDGFVFEISNISMYDFNFKAEDFKDGIFSSKVKGDVYLNTLILRNPVGVFDQTLIYAGAKGKAEKPLFSNTVIYQNPKEFDNFLEKFGALWDKFENERQQQEFDKLVEEKAKELIAQNQ